MTEMEIKVDGKKVAITENAIDGLRETLKRLEDEGMCYTDEIYPGKYGTFWDDDVNGIFYGLATDDLYVYVDDLTDEELNNIIIGEMN